MWVTGGQHDVRQRRTRLTEDRSAFASNSVEYGEQPVGPGLHCGVVLSRHRIRTTGAEKVGQDHPTERREAVDVTGNGRLIPQQVDGMLGARHQKKVGSVTEYLIGHMGVAHQRVSRFWNAGHATSMSADPRLCV